MAAFTKPPGGLPFLASDHKQEPQSDEDEPQSDERFLLGWTVDDNTIVKNGWVVTPQGLVTHGITEDGKYKRHLTRQDVRQIWKQGMKLDQDAHFLFSVSEIDHWKLVGLEYVEDGELEELTED